MDRWQVRNWVVGCMGERGSTLQRKLKSNSHWGRKRISAEFQNAGLQKLFKKRIINWVKHSWKAEKEGKLSTGHRFNNLVTADLDNWCGRMVGMKARECCGGGRGDRDWTQFNKDNFWSDFAIKTGVVDRGEKRVSKEKLLFKVGRQRELCWGEWTSTEAELTMNSEDLCWWCRQIIVGKRDPLWSTVKFF